MLTLDNLFNIVISLGLGVMAPDFPKLFIKSHEFVEQSFFNLIYLYRGLSLSTNMLAFIIQT